jgi:hypothetical protein
MMLYNIFQYGIVVMDTQGFITKKERYFFFENIISENVQTVDLLGLATFSKHFFVSVYSERVGIIPGICIFYFRETQ